MVIKENSTLYEIYGTYTSNEYIFLILCKKIKVICKSQYFNSIIIEREKDSPCCLIELNTLTVKRPFEIVLFREQLHIIADTLDITSNLEINEGNIKKK